MDRRAIEVEAKAIKLSHHSGRQAPKTQNVGLVSRAKPIPPPKAQMSNSNFNLSALNGSNGFRLNGIVVRNGLSLGQFALEIALGAKNEDIVILQKKISSATLMSNAIDTPLENQAISTPAYANFGRTWLAPLGDTSASVYATETALAGFVANANGVF